MEFANKIVAVDESKNTSNINWFFKKWSFQKVLSLDLSDLIQCRWSQTKTGYIFLYHGNFISQFQNLEFFPLGYELFEKAIIKNQLQRRV